ncbi:Fc.00g031560.m01.CDS01 [Cosmosporella sp. VM-42]
MAENVIRKACDRCHAQKLSCKRSNDEACERCVRLKTECKSSPSLRYKKHQQLQLQYQQPSQQPLSAPGSTPSGRRSPKRRRTDSDPSLVPPEAVPIVPHTGGLTSKSHLVVTPDPPLDIGDFNFNFDQLDFLVPGQSEHLSHPGLPSGIDDFHSQSTFTDSWGPRLPSSTDAYPISAPNPLSQADSHRIVPQVPLRRRSCVPEHSISDKRPRPRTKQRPRQITLRQNVDTTPPQPRETPTIHWMAQLSDVNARLLDLSSALPSTQDTARNGPSLGRPTDERFKGQGFPIDEMFKLTRRVADILEQPPSSAPSESPRARHSTVDSSDPGNSMFILSTYVRLLDMYQKVFSLVHSELSHADSGATFRFWKLPDVTVGSFAVESSQFLQMSLTIQLAEEFLSRLRNSTACWSRAGTNGASMFSGVVNVSFQAVKDQEESLSKHLVQLRSEIEALLDS